MTLLLEEALNLLNTLNPTRKSLTHIIAVIKELFQNYPNMHCIAMVTTKAGTWNDIDAWPLLSSFMYCIDADGDGDGDGDGNIMVMVVVIVMVLVL